MQNLKEKAQKIKKKLNNTSDIIIRENRDEIIMYIDGISDIKEIDLNLIGSGKDSNIAEKEIANTIDDLVDALLHGKAIRLGVEDYIFNTTKYDMRPVAEPPTSVVIKGPREGFTENVKVNVGLLR